MKPIDVHKYDQYIGKRFNKLTILEAYDPGPVTPHLAMAKCRCDCGNIVDYKISRVIIGDMISCGHCPSKYDAYVGQRFNHLVVLKILSERTKDGRPLCECICDCGRVTKKPAGRVIAGLYKTCGCDGFRGRKPIKNPGAKRKKREPKEPPAPVVLQWYCPHVFKGCIWSDVKHICCHDCKNQCPEKCLNSPEKCGAKQIDSRVIEEY